ncbi:MAG TPA: general secretion pathway protein GspB [Steroidobacteraceae bacterium]|jgi:general secretion pathway protein B|nr:general secretion pathway protein GspB [Steroidobacteraceae bacterium]
MSFILDALKKSEAERQRQSGPTLLELRITQPRRRYPAWAMWVGALLALNVAVLLYALLLRRPAAAEASVAAAPSLPAAAGANSAVTSLPSAQAPASAASASTAAPNLTAVAPLAPNQATAPSTAAAANATAPASANPADDEPAVPAAATSSQSVDYSTLPSLASLGGDLPALQLNLLDYSPLPAERFALINMHRVREGDVLPEGPRVLAITRVGVALDYHGQDFILRSSGSSSSQ